MDELQIAKAKAYQIIGRNLLLVQQLEKQFKLLRYLSEFRVELHRTVERREEEWRRISSLTMGQVVAELKKTLWLSDDVEQGEAASSLGTAAVSFSVRFGSDEFRKSSVKAMDELVAERNNFAHNLVSALSVNEQDSWLALCELQSDYQSRLIERVNYYQNFTREFLAGLKQHADFLSSDTGKRLLDQQFISQSRLAIALMSIWFGRKRDDGWLLLSTAGSILQRQLPEDYSSLKSQYGVKSLGEFALKSDLFDLSTENFDGRERSIMRVKPDVVQAIAHEKM